MIKKIVRDGVLKKNEFFFFVYSAKYHKTTSLFFYLLIRKYSIKKIRAGLMAKEFWSMEITPQIKRRAHQESVWSYEKKRRW